MLLYYYLLAIKKYAQFSGRSSRAEYRYFALFNIIVTVILNIISKVILINAISNFSESGSINTFLLGGLFGGKILVEIYSIFILIPFISVSIRRLHDIGKNGRYILIGLIPIIGWIRFLALMLGNSNTGENKYGIAPD